MMTDQELLNRYLDTNDAAAFDELVRRHTGMVYAAARRLCADEAADVTQAVFVILFRKAASLRGATSLAGWLYETTRLCSSNARKLAGRRRHHETKAAMERAEASAGGSNLEASVLADLDHALKSLPTKVREAVVLRYLEGRTPDEVARSLSISAAAASKRTTRGIEQLRDIFARRGVAVPVATIIAVLVAQGGILAPTPVLASVSVASLSAPTAASSSIATVGGMSLAWKLMATCAALFAVTVATGALIFIQRGGATPQSAKSNSAVATPATPSKTPVSPPAVEAGLGSQSVMARFTTLVDADVLPQVLALGKPVAGQPLRLCSAAEIFDVLRRAQSERHVVVQREDGMSHQTLRGQNAMQFYTPQFWHDFPLGRRMYTVGFTWSRSPTVQLSGGNSARLKLADPQIEVMLQEYASEPRELRTSHIAVDWTGDLAPGEALVLTHDYGAMREHHFAAVSVYHVYRGSPQQVDRINGIRDGGEWLRLGPDGARALADRAIGWAANRNLDPKEVAPKWTKALDNGATVRLHAVGTPRRWPFCWWDGDGGPIAKDWTELSVGLDAQKAVVLAYEGLARDRRSDAYPIPAKDDSIEVWVGNGPWQEQEIGVGEDVALGDGGLHFVSADLAGGTLVALVKGDLGPDIDAYIDCVTTTGERITCSEDRSVCLVTSAYKRWKREDENLWVEKKKVDHYVLRWQRRQKAAFAGFAGVPTTQPAELTP